VTAYVVEVNEVLTDTITYTPDPAMSYWPTPADIADDLVYPAIIPGHGLGEAAGDVPQIRILEPSAGEGHLARIARGYLPHAHITAVEPSPQRAAALRDLDGVVNEVVESTLEDYLAGGADIGTLFDTGNRAPFDLVFMNPPFALAGRPEAWAEHVLAICLDPTLVAPGGTVGAIVPRVVLTGKSKLTRAVRDLIGPLAGRYADGTILGERGQIEPCAKGAFSPTGAGVSTALVWVHKPLTATDRPVAS
jgi:predicted RNA methylase